MPPSLGGRGVVLSVPVGRPRSFAAGFWLSVVTFGVYGIYWNYRAHDELYPQFELAREGVPEGVEYQLMGFVLPPMTYAYLHRFVTNVARLRERMGLAKGISPGTFVGYQVTAWAVLLALVFTALILSGLARETIPCSRFDFDCEPRSVLVKPELELAAEFLVGFAILQWVALKAIAYYGLQRDINQVWAQYEQRRAILSPPPAPARPPSMAARGWQSAPPPAPRQPMPPGSTPPPRPPPRAPSGPPSR